MSPFVRNDGGFMAHVRMLALLAGAMMLTACANSSGLAARTKVSGFDGTRHVWIPPHGTNCGMSMTCTSLGAEWDSAEPQSAALVVAFDGDYVSIEGAALNIDGKITPLPQSGDLTHFSNATGVIRESQRSFLVPLTLVRSVAASHRTWLQVRTSSGTVESLIVDGAKDSKAFHAMGRFLAQVDAYGR